MSTLAGTLYLELVVNQRASGRVVPVQAMAGRFKVNAADLRHAGLPAAEPDGVWLDTMTGMTVHYDSGQQRLLLTVPPQWLPDQQLGETAVFARQIARSSAGGLLNYQIYSSMPNEGGGYTTAWNEARVFGTWGVLRNTGIYRWPHGAGRNATRGYQRYDTQWRYSDEGHAVTYEVGDLISNSLAWNRPARMAGVQVSRDFSVRPDVITYPLPQFSGEASVPTTVDLFIDGYRNSTTDVAPGPFTLTNVPFINGAGQAVVVTTDALGRQVSATVPFYVSSELLNPGMSDYSLAMGSLRQDYGSRSLAYAGWAGSGSLRYGLTRGLTLETHAEGAGQMRAAGLGAVFTVGNAGTFNAARSASVARGAAGHQTTVGYQYANRGFSMGVQHIQRTPDYADLSSLDRRYRTGRRSMQANASASMGWGGSLGAAYFDVRDQRSQRTRLLNLSWSKPLWGNSSMWVSSNRQVGGDGWSVLMQLLIPIGSRDTLSGGVERAADGRMTRRLDYQRSVAGDGGFGWDLAYGDAGQAGSYRQAGLAWRGEAAQVEGGVYGQKGQDTRWASANGSLVFMDGALMAANGIQDAFVLVSTDGVADVPVRYENQVVGRTNRNGHLLMPWAISYYSGKYEVDTLDLPSNYRTDVVEQRVAVRAGSGYLLEFPIARVGAASIVLHDASGAPIAIGARVSGEDGQTGVVGWDGIVYLEQLQARNTLRVAPPGGEACRVAFDLQPDLEEIAHVGPLVCR
ncbi:fimbria/pilus outer membrane usher protein [Achromobacter kerstersii]|jgi:outer membrane usher protein|uniref:F1 capsule-anchoring protein n=1 Tax=Achromobacter kerstersii TaxID=1353890 RepID=A0A6S7AEB9_9BURK|nr:fimbria/pilus outer membrane usher protein [Achromobacter kerstersii]CAB3726730.1 F1 capsule-anchoring protein [Achromobacter kerstersii]